MWVLLSLLFLVLLYGACVLAAWAAWAVATLVLAVVRRRSTTKARALLWVFAGLPISAAGVAVVFAGMWWHSQRPAVVFEAEFGFAPPADTTVLKSDVSWIGDSGHVCLHFRATPDTIARIVATGFNAGPRNVATTANKPDWFTPPPLSRAVIYTAQQTAPASPVRGRFSSEHARLIHDAAAGEVWYEYVGID